MEFLDDLLNQPESQEEPEDRQKAKASGGRGGEQPAPPPTPSYPVVTDEEAWADLLEGVDFDEAGEADAARKKRARRRRLGRLSTGQKVALGVLGIVVIGLWAVILVVMGRSLASRDQSPEPQSTVNALAETGNTTPTPETVDVGAEPTATPTLAVTPSPTPPIATAFDIRIQENPDEAALYVQRGRQYIELGAYEAALADFARAQELDGTLTEAYIGEGWTYFYSGRWQRAEEAFSAAIELDEAAEEAHFGLGKVTFYQGRYEDAAREFDAAAEINPTNAEAEAWLGIAAAKLDDGTEAFGAVTRAMSQTTELAIVYVAQSWARRTEDPPDIDGAQADLLYARELEPNSFLTLNALAQFYVDYRPERLAEAEQLAAYAENWAVNDVQRAVALQTLGEVYLAQNRPVDAERVLLSAIDLLAKEGDPLLVGLEEDLNRARE